MCKSMHITRKQTSLANCMRYTGSNKNMLGIVEKTNQLFIIKINLSF